MIKYKSEDIWVDLSGLPQFQFNNKTHVSWEQTVGYCVPFQYNNVCGEINIVGYKQQKITHNRHRAILSIIIDKYVPEPIDVRSDFITNCQFYNILSNRIVNKASDLIQYLDNPDDAYKYSYQSNEKIWTKCPICGHRDLKSVSNIYRYGFVCPCTSDGVSIPNKMMFNILRQLNIDFINEVNKSYGFSWMENYLYDFYFIHDNQPIIVEMDGFYHQFQSENDAMKTRIAENNGCKLIRIDCIYQNVDAVDYIKNNILKSELATILPLEHVRWDECRKAATNSLLMQVCDLWETTQLGISQMVKIFCISRVTVRKYLQRGCKIGLCPSYNETESRRRSNMNRSISVVDLQNIYEQYKMITDKEKS